MGGLLAQIIMRILSLEAKALVHATEDREKVMEAFQFILPFPIEYTSQIAKGQYGNPIEVILVKVTHARDIRAFLKHIAANLGKEWKRLGREIEQRFSSGKFYIRFDKMKAYLGELSLGKELQVELTVTSYPYNEDKIKKELRKLFENVH